MAKSKPLAKALVWPGQTFELGTWHIAIDMATCLGPGTWAQCLLVIFLKHYHSAFFYITRHSAAAL